MRYTKLALLVFGAGLMLGVIVIAGDIDALARFASGLMALGISAIPFGIAFDWRRAIRAAPQPAKKRAKRPVRRAPTPSRRTPRTRSPAAGKR